MAYLIYVLVKLTCYTLWCWIGLRLWRQGSANAIRSLGIGFLRLMIGVSFGVAIFFAVPTDRSNLLWKYIEIYAPVRMLEWFIVVLIIRRAWNKVVTPSSLLWSVGGIVVSFAADLASPEGLAGHFCVGRCLC
jgi:hypothetical protein